MENAKNKFITRYFLPFIVLFIAIFNLPRHTSLVYAATPPIRVSIIENTREVTISATNDYVMKATTLQRSFRFPANKQLHFQINNHSLFLNNKPLPDNFLIIAVKAKQPVIVNGTKYRGALALKITGQGIQVINRLPLEEYLYGVVPAEMPSGWSSEALKAQAIAARTFALYSQQNERGTHPDYDVCATTRCQVYNGMRDEHPATTAAINATRGKIIAYNHTPIFAAFHAASGGSTENSEDVWGSSVPYLRATADAQENSPYNNWQKLYSLDQFSQLLRQQDPQFGKLKFIDLHQYQRNKPGTTKRMVRFIDTTGHGLTLTGTQVRTLFKLNSSNFTMEILNPEPSAFKPVLKSLKGNIHAKPHSPRPKQYAQVATKQHLATPAELNTQVKISGSGLGHRLGLSQWGAKALAESGKNYTQILYHYYSDVTIENLY